MSYPAAEKGREHESKITIDESGKLTVECRDPENPSIKVIGNTTINI